ncbi:MAG: hypothetical protein EA403_03180 [Spirochaetaceae bacterium]|nr:MAG: hypothetical protein EA403_03180 [Spirochaetaceae bacterium]
MTLGELAFCVCGYYVSTVIPSVQSPAAWQAVLSSFPIDRAFENSALRDRAIALYREGRCVVKRATDDGIEGRVAGRTGVYSVHLRRTRDGLGFSCTCPSDYYPCKHAGALLYTVRDLFGASTSTTNYRSDSGASARNRGTFRPAFLIEQDYHRSRGRRHRYRFLPILVYLRRDGADGRIEPYSATKVRVEGDRETEKLLARCRAHPNGLSVARLMTRWRDQAANQSDRMGFSLPVEVYLSRASHWERERRAHVRRIDGIEIDWMPEESYEASVMQVPHITLVDSEGNRDTIERGSGAAEITDRGVILPVFSSGSIWYLFDHDVPELSQEGFGAVADVLTLQHARDHQEIALLHALCCDGQLAALVRVVPPVPMRIVTVAPVPVVDLAEDSLGYVFARLLCRYGDHEVSPTTPGKLLPVTAGELDRLRVSTDGETEGTLWYISRSDETEKGLRNALRDTVRDALREARGAVDGTYFAGDRFYSLRESLWDFVAATGPKLLERGFELRVAGAPVARSTASRRYRVVESGESWFDVEPTLMHAGEYLEIDEVIARRLVRSGGRIFVLTPGDEIPSGFTERQRIHVRDVAAIDEIIDRIENRSHPALLEYHDLRERLSSFDAIAPAAVPPGFTGVLRSYQRDGLSWLRFLHDYGLGGILADDMGLGKTIQTLALLLSARQEGAMERALVVCPVSTLSNWEDECRRFAPGLRALVHGGQGRATQINELRDHDIVLVSYDTFLRDAPLFRALALDYLILDEAQTIKNPSAKRRRALAELSAPHRIALTGTPVENGVLELWSIMDVLMPGLLGARSVFSRRYGGGKRGGVDHEALARLQRIIRPLVLRRTKAQVAPELPPREEQIVYAELGSRQAALYETLRSTFQQMIEAQLAAGVGESGGDGSSGATNPRSMMILEAMLRLRQVAILPALVDDEHCTTPAAKMDLMVDMLSEIAAEGNKALVFSQFTAVLDEAERRLQAVPMTRFRLDGSTPQPRRADQIAAFQNATGSACFLISLKAGGTGINLTAADYVVLLDPWWNPAVEAQAIDRSHRIGRQGTVFAYRLVARGTIEEKILRLQERKREMANAVIKADDGLLGNLSVDDLRELFSR